MNQIIAAAKSIPLSWGDLLLLLAAVIPFIAGILSLGKRFETHSVEIVKLKATQEQIQKALDLLREESKEKK